MNALTREDFQKFDRDDSLAGFREEFFIPQGVIYMDGNSLGAMPKAVARRVSQVTEREWGHDLIKSWNTADWFTAPQRIGDKIAKVREKSKKMGDLFIALVEQKCAEYGFGIASPRNADARGSQVSLIHPEGYAIMQALIERGVIGDFRAPDILRFGFTPLYLRYVDVWDAVDILADIMAKEIWQDPKYQVRAAVT
jgi:kynureninase